MHTILTFILLTHISLTYAKDKEKKLPPIEENKSSFFKMMNEQQQEILKKLQPDELTKLKEIQLSEEQKNIMLNQARLQVFMLTKMREEIELRIAQTKDQGENPIHEDEESIPREEQEKSIDFIDLAQEDLSRINLQQLTYPLPTQLKVGSKITWNYPFTTEGYGRRRHDDVLPDGEKNKPVLIFGERKLKIKEIKSNRYEKTLTISDDLNRTFSIGLIDWLRTQHTKDGEGSILHKIIQAKSFGYALQFSKCIETIGELKEKCFNVPFKKDPAFKICPPQNDFPAAIAQSLNFLCGHVEKPRLKIKSISEFNNSVYYLVDAEPDTIYYLDRFRIANFHNEQYAREVERKQLMAKADEQRKNMRFEPRNFSQSINRAHEKGDMAEVEALIKEGLERKNEQGENLIEQIFKDRFSSHYGIFDYFSKKGQWDPIIDEILSHQTYGKFRIDHTMAPQLLFLRTLFMSDHMAIEEIRKSPELLKGWEEFITKHKIIDVTANHSLYTTRRQGTVDPSEPFLARLGLLDEFKKYRDIHNHLANTPQPTFEELKSSVQRFPFLVDTLPNRYREDGKLCLAAVEAELKSDYFAKGICRFMTYHGSIHNWACLPREKYPPNGEGYMTACKNNFKAWVKKIYPEKFAKK